MRYQSYNQKKILSRAQVQTLNCLKCMMYSFIILGIPIAKRIIIKPFFLSSNFLLNFQIMSIVRKKYSKMFGAKKKACLKPKTMNATKPKNLQPNKILPVFLAKASFHFNTTRNSKNKYHVSKTLSM